MLFNYQATDPEQNPVRGEIEADSVSLAIARLEADGLTLLSISSSAAGMSNANAALQPVVPPLSHPETEQAVLRAHLAKVLSQGKAIAPALSAYAEELANRRWRRELLEVVRILHSGNLDEAAIALKSLPDYWIPLLSAASVSNDPGRILNEYFEESERSEELRRQWSQVLAYPLVVAGLAGAVLVTLSLLVLPAFLEVFADFGLVLPDLTMAVFYISHWINSGQILITVGALLAASVVFWAIARALPEFARSWFADRFSARFGRSLAVARFSRFTADLLDAGVTTPDAIAIAGFATKTQKLQTAAWKIADGLRTGKIDPRLNYRPVPVTVVHALGSNMSQVSRSHLLREIGNCHAAKVGAILSWTRGLAGPIAILAIGTCVGIVVVALFLPLTILINNLSGSFK